MKTTTIVVAVAMLMAVSVPSVQAVDPLVDANRATMIDLLGDDYDPHALDSSDPTDLTPRTMEQAVDETATMLADLGIDLGKMLQAHETAQPGAFPIVSSAAGAGLMLEVGLWAGSLPVRCNVVHVHDVADAPAGPDKLLASPLSHHTQVNVAAGVDAAGTMPQIVTYFGTEVFAAGDLLSGCVEFELCVFGVCLLSFVTHAAALVTGVITNDVTGTETLSVAHAAADPFL